MYRVLVFGLTENSGGIESVIINYFNNIDKRKIHFDFLCNFKGKIAYEDYLKSKGSRFFKITSRKQNPLLFKKELKSFFKKYGKKYNCLWINLNSLVNIDYIIEAKKSGIDRIIIHSHNTEIMESGISGKVKSWIHNFNKNRIDKYVTDFWACSMDAAKWMFPQKVWHQTKIIRNAINPINFKFNEDERKKIRSSYDLEDSIIIGNVGRLQYQKNQEFIIRIIKRLSEKRSNLKLVLIGDGPDRLKLEKDIETLNLERNVLVLGKSEYVSKWYNAFDLFLFPSRFEGISVALLEAQANGLPILASSSVNPQEVTVNSNLQFLNLNQSVETWIKYVEEMMNMSRIDYDIVQKNFINSGYDIHVESKKVENLFLNGRK